MKKTSKKGQVFTMDFALSLFGFLMVFLVLIGLWNLYSTRLQDNIEYEEMQLLTFQIMDVLTKTQGLPNDWENDPVNLEVIGLKYRTGVLDQNKIDAFLALSDDQVKQKFNIERFQYNFKIVDDNNVILDSIGVETNESTNLAIAINHFVLIDSLTREIVFTLWK
jgi:hypothetical protein